MAYALNRRLNRYFFLVACSQNSVTLKSTIQKTGATVIMIALGKIIHTMLGCSRNWKFQLVTNWPTIVGSLAARMHIEKIEHDSIIIGVCDSAWLQELYLLSDVLLQKIN